MARLQDSFVFRSPQHIYQVGDTEALASPKNTGQRLLDRDSSIPGFRRVQAGIAIAAGSSWVSPK